ncbi:TetR/AcrR family transcriptional regulator C-terminal domain-containing protein [Actinoplanes subtropicus]|uniref:TetR/AcrR family transcriptional regulator C-terminal domain-containing protein n=1 Tax=Actinoplanes subtropicus TaxID=543632 RepID=UPI00068D6C4D|nr:TetR/AcrR family transcriptional regulator C-terminal domain-containing protein [Actinoplanes subtropicus]
MPRPSTPLLSRAQIATAALALIDEAGTFTLPGLAKALSVSPSSIYHHFPGGRESIVEAIRGLLAAEGIETEPGGRDWRRFVEDWSRAYREEFARHPRAVPLLTGQVVTDPETLAGYEAVARVLRDAGFRDETLLHAVTILDSFIIGSALDASAPLGVWADSPDPGSALGSAIRAARNEPARSSERSFEIGLRIILDGLGAIASAVRQDPIEGRPASAGRPPPTGPPGPAGAG